MLEEEENGGKWIAGYAELVLINDRNWLTDERGVRRRVGVERTRVAHVVGLLAPFRQLHLYYVAVPSVEHQAHVAIGAAKGEE